MRRVMATETGGPASAGELGADRVARALRSAIFVVAPRRERTRSRVTARVEQNWGFIFGMVAN